MPRPPLRTAPPAFLVFGAFSSSTAVLDQVRALVEERFGPLHPRGASPFFPFPETRTYRKTMGASLKRRFYVLAERWPQDGLAPVKLAAIDMEEALCARWAETLGIERPANIDPGLLNDCRVILATTKDHAHRIYRGQGVWEEVTLVYRDGAYRGLPWTYPDFLNPDYHAFFEPFRREMIEQRRE